jgi:ABC-type transport system substrate-binding protein
MKLRSSPLRAAINLAISAGLLAWLALFAPVARVAPSQPAPARRPHYGGTLRVEIGAAVNSLDPAIVPANADDAAAKADIEALLYEKRNDYGSLVGVAGSGPFRISEWEPGKHLALAANDNFSGGRPFVDAIEIDMGRNAHDRLVDLEIDRTDFAEIPPEDARQAIARGVRVSVSQPDELIALAFVAGRANAQDARLREAISCAINRAAIVEFILQKEGEPAGGLLPQWSSGTAFLFPALADPVHAKELRSQIGPSPEIRLGYDSGDVLQQSIAERIIVDARESGIVIAAEALAPGSVGKADARLVRLAMPSARPAAALAKFLGALAPLAGIEPAAVPETASPEQIYAAERAALNGFRVVPLVWLPQVYGLNDRVKDWQVPAAGEPWPFADVWLDVSASAPSAK